MKWNWEQTDWPHFVWNATRLAKAEERFLFSGGLLLGTIRHMGDEDREVLAVGMMSDEAITTSAIEGEVLDRDSVQSSIRRELGLASDRRTAQPGEQGIAEMMVDLYRRYNHPLDAATLLAWHEMICRGRRDLRDVGRYRTHAEVMQVVSGRLGRPTVHFEAPPSKRVAAEMATFIDWFNRTAPGAKDALPALTRAGIAHLYFESIHPFEDGNGRVGRAISEKAMAQALGRPSLTALAPTILANRSAYYDALEAANKKNEVTEWLAWFAGIAIEAQQRTVAQVEFVIDQAKLLDRFRDALNDRQLTVLLRVLREGPAGFKGGLSAGKYVAIAKTSASTATRDLAEMVDLSVVTRTGERKHARYHPAIPLRPVPRVKIGADGEIVETPRKA